MKAKSDGKTGVYYDIKLPKSCVQDLDTYNYQITAGDIMLNALDNDYDKSSIFKALVRLDKKEGVGVKYDLSKIEYHLERLRKRYEIENPFKPI